jgi:hypothetical protein
MIKSNRIYINNLNQKIFDKPGYNEYSLNPSQVLGPKAEQEIIFNTTIAADYPEMTNFNGADINVTENGMYSINCIIALASNDHNTIGIEFTLSLIVIRNIGDLIVTYILSEESGRIEAVNFIETVANRFRTISTVAFLKADDKIEVLLTNNLPFPASLSIVNSVSIFSINRIY